MNVREKLVELMSYFADGYSIENRHIVDGTKVCDIADHLVDHGVTVTDYHLDALDFLKMFPDNYADCVIYDPPYSLRQVSECYKGVGREVTMETTQSSWRARHLDEIARILKPNGVALCFGWNSNGVGKTRGFEMQEVLIVPHGGSKNDTICTVERKVDVDQKED